MGIEALSRGAARCVFVESEREACAVVTRNLEKLGLTGALVLCRDVAQALREERARGRRYDVVLADAPYDAWDSHAPVLGRSLPELLEPGGLAVVETAARVEPELPLDLVTTRRYGSARITVFRNP
jgi:16S rRNA (guanine966-N2)-methyltransferase